MELEQRMFEGWAHVSRAEDTDAWVAYCPHFDVMTIGDSPAHAFHMIREAVAMVILDDLNDGRDPHRRASRKPEDWEPLRRLQRSFKDEVPVQRVNETDYREFALRMSWPFRLAVSPSVDVTEEETVVSQVWAGAAA